MEIDPRVEKNISKRKDDHLMLALESQVDQCADTRFDYEPMLSAHPQSFRKKESFLGKTIEIPLWISSMTGGGKQGQSLNQRLARVASEFGMGMGLGSCRVLLEDKKTNWDHFNLRPILGNQTPFWGNIGIAQLESKDDTERMLDYFEELSVDGVIIHINPLQEFFQNEGDRLSRPPLETLEEFLEFSSLPVIIKEVGQGMGPESLKALLKTKVVGIELAAYGGTNFTKLETLRNNSKTAFDRVGHTALAMIHELNQLDHDKEIIISGGVKSVLDAYYLRKICKAPSVIGQASKVLEFANLGEKELFDYIEQWAWSYRLSENYLRLKWN